MNITSREDLLMELFHCGIADLGLIDDIGYDACDVLAQIGVNAGLEARYLDINSYVRGAFECGFDEIQSSIDDRIEELENEEQSCGLDDDEQEELEAIRKLNPWEDIDTFNNCIDTHVWFEKNAEIYHKYLSDALDSFHEGTGFEITGEM